MKITFNKGIAAKWDGKDRMVDAARKRTFGYNWWLWIPFFRWRFLKWGQDFNFSWLNFWVGFIINYRWQKSWEEGENSSAQLKASKPEN